MILKEDNSRKSEELVDNKIDISCDVTDNSETDVDKLEPQLSSDRSSPVINSTLPTESVDKSAKIDIILTNLSEIHSERDDNENNRINEIKNKEINDEPVESECISSAKTLLPDLPYKDDQWTPLNPDGKKHYDREFLFAVKTKSESILKMPKSLQTVKNQEIIRKVSNVSLRSQFRISANDERYPCLTSAADNSSFLIAFEFHQKLYQLIEFEKSILLIGFDFCF